MNTQQLRQKVLDLAIHGKLVKQDKNDEPATLLLEKIKKEKERLIKEGIYKDGKRNNDYPLRAYNIPEGWVWCKTGDIAYVTSGSTPSKDAFVEKGIPYIKMYNLRNQKIDFDYRPQFIKEEVHNGKLARSRTQVGDLIMNIVGPPLGKLAFIPKNLPQANFNQAAVLIRPFLYKDIIGKYLFYYLEQMSEINSISTKGSAGQVNISLTQAQNMRIPLPPLAEQHRIVAEIEKWMRLIDVIEENQAGLNDNIDKAKAKILDLAVHGKLVEKEGEWEYPTIKELFKINPKNDIDDDIEVGFVPMSLVHDGFTNAHSFETRKWKDVKKAFTHFMNGDIAVAKISPCFENRKFCVMRDLPNGYGAGTTELFIFRSEKVLPKYGYFFFCTNDFIRIGTSQFKGTVGQQRVKRPLIESVKFPLPPLSEQHRIVSKIEQLFAALDEMKKMIK